MIVAEDVQHPVPQETEDARDLQLRLYRDIGIAAVAAALVVGAERREPIGEPGLADVAAVPRGDDRAA
jgi:hypothetical protein